MRELSTNGLFGFVEMTERIGSRGDDGGQTETMTGISEKHETLNDPARFLEGESRVEPKMIHDHRRQKRQSDVAGRTRQCSALVVSEAEMLFDVSKENLDDPAVFIPQDDVTRGKPRGTGQEVFDTARLLVDLVFENDKGHRAELTQPYLRNSGLCLSQDFESTRTRLLEEPASNRASLKAFILEEKPMILFESSDEGNMEGLKEGEVFFGGIPVVEGDKIGAQAFAERPVNQHAGQFIFASVFEGRRCALFVPEGESHGDTPVAVAPQQHHEPLSKYISSRRMIIIPIHPFHLPAPRMRDERVVKDQPPTGAQRYDQPDECQHHIGTGPMFPRQLTGEMVVTDSTDHPGHLGGRLFSVQPQQSSHIRDDAHQRPRRKEHGDFENVQRNAHQRNNRQRGHPDEAVDVYRRRSGGSTNHVPPPATPRMDGFYHGRRGCVNSCQMNRISDIRKVLAGHKRPVGRWSRGLGLSHQAPAHFCWLKMCVTRVKKIMKWTVKILLLFILLPFLLTLPVGCFDYQVVSLVGDKKDPQVIRQKDVFVSMQTTAELLNTRNPHWRFDKKIEMERLNMENLETKFLREYLTEKRDTEHLQMSDTELFSWGRETKLIRRPEGLQGYRWWMKENKILFLGFL